MRDVHRAAVRLAATVWVLGLGLGLMAGGCQKPAANPALDRFLSTYAPLPAADREAALRAKAAAGGPEAALAHYALGNDFYASSEDTAATADEATARLDSARVHFASAAAIDTTFLEAYVNLGSVWDDLADRATGGTQQALRQERLEGAEKAYRHALALRPTDEKARCNLGALYVKKRQHAEAMAQFKQALADNPGSPLAHYNMAILFAESKMYREAKREWEAAAKADPKGDVGRRSRENVKIIQQMMSAPVPGNLEPKGAAAAGH